MEIRQLRDLIDLDLFLEREKVNDFICCICMSPLIDPYIDNCEGHRHIFCRDCIKITLQKSHKCPNSRVVLEFNQLQKDEETETKMMELHLKCPFTHNGCNWVSLMKDLSQHLEACPSKYGCLMTREVDFPGSGGSGFDYCLDWKEKDMSKIKLREIVFDFTDQFCANDKILYSLMSFKLVWEETKSDGSIERIESPRVGGNTHQYKQWIRHQKTYKIKGEDKIHGFVFYVGDDFYPAMGILSSKDQKLKTYGYVEQRKLAIPIIIPENATIIGFTGRSGWVIDCIGFYYYIDKKVKQTN